MDAAVFPLASSTHRSSSVGATEYFALPVSCYFPLWFEGKRSNEYRPIHVRLLGLGKVKFCTLSDRFMLLTPSFWSWGRAWYAYGATNSHPFEENDITGFSSTWPILYITKEHNASEHFLCAEEAHSWTGAMSVLLKGKRWPALQRACRM